MKSSIPLHADDDTTDILVCTEFNDDKENDKKNNIKKLFANKLYRKFLPYLMVFALVHVMPYIVMPAFGAKWFANCDDNDDDDECQYNYTKYNFYNSLFLSTMGLFSFLFSGYVGALSDIYGRKLFLILPLILTTFNVGLLPFYTNLYLYFSIQTVIAPFRSEWLSVLDTAYISDVVPNNIKTEAFTISQASMALNALFGSIIPVILTLIWNVDIVFFTMSSLLILETLYTLLFVKETVNKLDKEINNNNKCQNPFKPIFYVNSNPIILWVSFVSFLTVIVVKTLSILIIYINDQMNINDQGESTVINMLFFIGGSISATINGAFIVPFIRSKYEWAKKDVHIIAIGIIMLIISQLVCSLLAFITNDNSDNKGDVKIYCIIIIVTGSIFQGGMAWLPALKSLLSLYINESEQGVAFGVVESFTNIFGIIGPFTFGYTYNLSKDELKFPSLIFYVITILLLIALYITLVPLKRAVDSVEMSNTKFSFQKQKKSNNDKESLLEIGAKNTANTMHNDNYVTFDK